MIDQCQFCGHYGYLRQQGRAYLCGYCRRRPDAPTDGGEPADRTGALRDTASCDAC
jgi:hypothetical protein